MTIRRPVTVLAMNTLATIVTRDPDDDRDRHGSERVAGEVDERSSWTRPDVLPSVYANRAPSSRTNMPNVAMNGGTCAAGDEPSVDEPDGDRDRDRRRGCPAPSPGPPSATSTAVKPITAGDRQIDAADEQHQHLTGDDDAEDPGHAAGVADAVLGEEAGLDGRGDHEQRDQHEQRAVVGEQPADPLSARTRLVRQVAVYQHHRVAISTLPRRQALAHCIHGVTSRCKGRRSRAAA